MPELPEVETTKRGLQKETLGFSILDVWTDLKTKDKRKGDTVANENFFQKFKKEVLGTKIIKTERRAKNLLIYLSNKKVILVHLKMTGHLLFGEYEYNKKENKWVPKKDGPLKDPFNRFVHFVFTLKKGKLIRHLAFSDTRKFGKITLIDEKFLEDSNHLKNLGPEPLKKDFTAPLLKERLNKKPNSKIKSVLLDQSVLAGVGNIYSDEILWHSDIHPEKKINEITEKEIFKIFENMKNILTKGIDFGGDSMSDYRNIYGERGSFQMHHQAYRCTGKICSKKGCSGVIIKKIINNRSAHFCSKHQK